MNLSLLPSFGLLLALCSSVQLVHTSVIYSCFGEDVKTPSGTKPTRVTFPPTLSIGSASVALRLEENRPSCPAGEFVLSKGLPSTSKGLSVTRSNGGTGELAYFTQDGHARIGDEYYAAAEYCIQGLEKYSIELRVCQSSCSIGIAPSASASTVLCVPKCCNLGYGVSMSSVDSASWECARPATGGGTSEMFWKNGDAASDSGTHFVRQNLTCPNSNPAFFSPRNLTSFGFYMGRFRIGRNGDAVLQGEDTESRATIRFGDYCVDSFQDAGAQIGISLSSTDTGTFDLPEENQHLMLIVCESVLMKAAADSHPQSNRLIPIIYGVFLGLSCSLLLVTIVVHMILWEKQKFHMWVVLSYIASLLMLYIFLGLANLIHFLVAESALVETNDNTGCVIIGAATHLFLLSTFCWLTAINENLWATIRTLNIPNSTSLLEEERLGRFAWFSLFAWGIPILTVGCGLVLDFVFKNDVPNSFIILPNYGGEKQCLLSSSAEGWYLFYPLGILLVFNAIFFGLTICRLILYQKVIKDIIGERNDAKWKLISIYLKLLILALLIWIFEITAWMLKLELFMYYWLVVESLNLLQSVLIFSMFTCRESVWKHLVQKYSGLERLRSFKKTTINYGSNSNPR